MKKRFVFILVILSMLVATVTSCGIFKKDCDCPSVHGGKVKRK